MRLAFALLGLFAALGVLSIPAIASSSDNPLPIVLVLAGAVALVLFFFGVSMRREA